MALIDRLRSIFSWAQPSAPIPEQATQAPLPTRLLQIGLDFGTCWSKMVIRDYEAARPLAFVVRPSGVHKGPNDTYRVPSAVTLHRDHLYFGWPGHRKADQPDAVTCHSVKMRAAFPNDAQYKASSSFPVELTPEDLATLVVTYLLQVGSEAAVRYCGAQKPRSRPMPGVSMGVPMGLVTDPDREAMFLRIVRTALELIRTDAPQFSEGLSVNRAVRLLHDARHNERLQRPVAATRDWLRSEAEAGLLWVFQSPRVKPGLYACVDVGAGTTDVSFFRIAERHQDGAWQKARMGFYSASSDLPGVDAIDDVVCAETGATKSQLGPNLQDWLNRLSEPGRGKVAAVTQRIFEIYRRCWSDSYRKEKRESAWANYGLFVLGGGSKVPEVREALTGAVWPGRLLDRPIIDNEFPGDLFEFGGTKAIKPFTEDATFMLVAYGLSFMGSDLPPVDAPEDGADYAPPQYPKRSYDQDEFYPK